MSDFYTRLPQTRQHIISLLILFVVPLILFFNTTIGGKELQRSDITQYRAAVESVYEYQDTYEEKGLWATNMFGGMPSYVIRIEKSTKHLDTLIGKLQPIYPAGYYWVMFGGMYLLLTIMGFRSLSSCFGSILYGLTSYFAIIIIAGHTSKFHALAFIPWMFAGYWLLFKKEKKIIGLTLFTISLALEIRAGHPQITYYFFYLLGILWIFDSWNFIKEKATKNWALLSVLLLFATIVGVMGTTEKFLALQEYAQYSIRGGSDLKNTNTMDIDYAFNWSQGISETLTLINPNFYGGASPTYWGQKTFTSGPHYFGIIGFLFLVIAFFKVRKNMMYVFLGTGVLGIFFAWGKYFYALNSFAFNWIPYFDKFRVPETWLVLTIFCFAVVATYGFDWFQGFIEQKSVTIKNLYKPLITLTVIFLGLFLFNNSRDFIGDGEVATLSQQIAQQNQVSPENPQVRKQVLNLIQNRIVPEREEAAKSDVLRLGIFIILSIGVIYLITTTKLGVSIGAFILIILTIVDMIQVDKRYLPEQSFVASNLNPVRILESQKRDIDQYIIDNLYEENVYPSRVFPLLNNPFGSATYAYYYPLLGGYTAAKMSTFQDAFIDPSNPLFTGEYGLNVELLALMNTRFITYNQPLSIPGLTTEYQGQNGVVLEVDNVLPKAFFVDSTISVEDPIEAFDYLYPDQMNFRTTAVVQNFNANTQPDSLSKVEVTYYTGQEITIELERSTPGFLVLSEMYYPEGWVALLNGEPVDIHRTNYLLRGFQIPEGSHTLTLDFNPQSIELGSRLSWISFLIQIGLLALVGVTYLRKTNNDKES